MLFQVMFLVALFASCGVALWLGRSNERLTAVVLLACAIASPMVETSEFARPEPGILLIDGLLLVYLIALALRSDRFWPLWAAGFQVVGTLIHVARLVDSTIWPSAYATAGVFWGYPVLAALALGTWWEGRFREA
jgi:hypothetical protein